MRENCGAYPERLLADAGYWDAGHVDYCKARGVEAYIAIGSKKHDEPAPPDPGEPPEDPDARDEMTWKLRTPEGRAVYARRKVIVEPVFGQIRDGQGFQRFLLRGLEKTRGEWALVCAGHNLLKLFRAAKAAPA